MESKELRIGNLVQSSDGIENVWELCHYRKKEDWINDDLQSEIYPVPITEEWLMKAGFIYDIRVDNYVLKIHGCDHKLFIVPHPEQKINKEALNNAVYYSDGEHINLICSIKHVHQLQNLYFTLTGEELEIK